MFYSGDTNPRKFVRFVRTHFASLLLFTTLFLSMFIYSVVVLASPKTTSVNQEIPSIIVPQLATEIVKDEPVAKTEPVAQTVPVQTTKPAPAVSKPAPAYDRVSISSLGITSQLVTVGTTATNNIDVHPNLIGWWSGSANIGTPGAAFLDGHNPGVFSRLPNIGVGAVITITKANGEVFNYTVVHTETVQLAGINMHRALSTWNGATEGLNIMTCIGAYNPSTNTTDQRFVVYAVRS